jgi:hypothetical protein
VKDGLPAVRKRELDESLTSWAAAEEETILDALTRALLPFMIFALFTVMEPGVWRIV